MSQKLNIDPDIVLNTDWADIVLGQVSPSIIFEKTPDGKATKDALLYQDILQYFFEKIEPISNYSPETFAFFFSDLAGWLVMKKNREFTAYYSDSNSKVSMSNRIACRRNRIRKCLDNLHSMGLIFQFGPVKARKNKLIETRLYIFTPSGKIVSNLIKSDNPDASHAEKAAINHNVFQLLNKVSPMRLLTDESEKKDSKLSSRKLFISRFFRVCYEHGLFDEIVRAMRDILSTTKVHFISDLVDSIVYDHTIYTNKRFRASVWKVFSQTLESFDAQTRSIVLFYDKVQIEMGLAEQYKSNSDISAWERLWIKNINNCSKLTVIGHCKDCEKKYPLTIDYLEYKQGLFILDDRELVVMECKKCNAKDSLLISTFVKRKQLFS